MDESTFRKRRSDAGQPACPSRSTPDLIGELQVPATTFTVAAIAVMNNDVSEFVFAIDDDPLDRLNTLVAASSAPR